MDNIYSIINFDDGQKSKIINSPRSLEACLKSGIDPSELRKRSREKFVSVKLTEEMIDKKFEAFEKKRQDKIDMVKAAREEIIELNRKKMSSGNDDKGIDLVEMMALQAAERSSGMMAAEIARMESLRRRQEKEIAKMIEKEKLSADLQLKIKKGEDEALKKERDRLKKVAEAKIVAQKKQIKFLQDKAEQEKEESIKRREMLRKEEEFAKKREIEKKRELKRIAYEARQKEIETAAKMEANRKKTEALLEAQVKLAEDNRIIMLQKEAKVRKQLEDKKAELAKAIQDKKDAAEKRIAEAMEKHHELHEHKKIEFQKKEDEALKRQKLKEIEDREKLKKQMQQREKRNTTRINRLIDAYKHRADHRDTIVERRSEKDKVYGIIQAERERELAMKKFESTIKKSEKQENIERQARVNEFFRLQTLSKIYKEDMNYAEIKSQRSALLKKHSEEVKTSLNRKHEIADAMEQMKISNDFSLLQKVFDKQMKASNSNKRASTTAAADEMAALGETHDPEDLRLNQTH